MIAETNNLKLQSFERRCNCPIIYMEWKSIRLPHSRVCCLYGGWWPKNSRFSTAKLHKWPVIMFHWPR